MNLRTFPRLSAPKIIEGPSSETISVEANYLTVVRMDTILSEDEANATIELTVRYGNMTEGKFIPLKLMDGYADEKIDISSTEFNALAMSPISPSEKGLSPFQIIAKRAMSFLIAKGKIIPPQ